MTYIVEFTKEAYQQLRSILTHLKLFTNNESTITQRQAEIISAARSLNIFPERYPINKNRKFNSHKMVTKHYILEYSIKNKQVVITKILTHRMNR